MPRGVTKKKAPGSKRAMKMLAEAERLNRLASPKAATPPAAAATAAAAAVATSPAGAPFITPPDQVIGEPTVPPPVRRKDMVAWLIGNASGGL